jgi:hypothetical protein
MTNMKEPTSAPTPAASAYRRVVTELCARLNVDDPESVMKGGKIGIEGCTFCLLLDETREHDGIFVYVDLGPSHEKDKAHAYKMLLKINFGLLAGAKGVMSVHPDNEHVFYSFRYPLDQWASGERLLATLLESLTELGLIALDTPTLEFA